MPERSPLEKKIISYAFEKGVDLDVAAFKIMRDIINETTNKRSSDGLYERLFGKGGQQHEAG